MAIEIPENDLQLVKVIEIEAGTQPYLIQALTDRGVTLTIGDIPHIVGMGGIAQRVTYTGPSGHEMTVLVIPHAYDVDHFTEEYFYFRMDAKAASLADWTSLYARGRELRDAASRQG